MSRSIHLPIPSGRGFPVGMGAAFFGTRGDLIIRRTLEKGDDHKLWGGIGKAGARGFGGPPGRGGVRPGGGAGGPPTPPRGGRPPER